MKKNMKTSDPYKTIGVVAKELNLINDKTGKPQTHTLRYWESQFKQIKPSIKAGGRRYYSENSVKIIHFVKFLLKEKGLTIKGVKRILNNPKLDTIDPNINLGIYKTNLKTKENIQMKIKKIVEIINELKKT
jgi:DNA-binding transcriptional MerR regulator